MQSIIGAIIYQCIRIIGVYGKRLTLGKQCDRNRIIDRVLPVRIIKKIKNTQQKLVVSD